MVVNGFKGLLDSLDNQELSELGYLDPFFLYKFCYMLSLEIELEKHIKSYERKSRKTRNKRYPNP